MSSFMFTEYSMYFLPAGLECDTDILVVYKNKTFTFRAESTNEKIANILTDRFSCHRE